MLRDTVFACLLLVGALAARSSSADVTGPATVVDGDTIVVAGERIRLQGIDAPELQQTCTAYGQPWACGRTSAEWLQEHLHGRNVECVGHARDRYQRLLAVCYVGGQSINEQLVRTKLHEFLPKSMPSTTILIGPSSSP
jgi:endonuclease YncB( thermonuclease family)